MAHSALLVAGSTLLIMGFILWILLSFDGMTRGYSLLQYMPPLVAGFVYGSILLAVIGCIAIVVAIKLE
jgi:hypothetical protein